MLLPKNAGNGRPLAEVAVFGLQRRKGDRHKRPWVVRWAIAGRQRSRSFRTRQEAERFRTGLSVAAQSGEDFDRFTGEPVSWQPVPADTPSHDWVRRWLAEQWPEWAPRTRVSALEAVVRLVPLLVSANAPTAPRSLRAHLVATLPPDGEVGDSECARWLNEWSLPLVQLSRSVLAVADQRLGLRDDGQPLGPATAARYRKVSRSCIRRAVDLGVLEADPWPPTPRGRASRKSVRIKRTVNVRTLPDPATMARVLEAITSHQPASERYRVMTAVAYYGGLRPSEVVMLRARSLHLPKSGWGRIHVTEADIAFDVPGEPKTGARQVPIPPVLVELLRDWCEVSIASGEDFLFRTRTGRRPTASNWSRALHRALRSCGCEPFRIYDCRHAAATTWLRAGVPLGDVAKRLGHSVETLVSTYVGVLDGDDVIANERIEAVLAVPEGRPAA